MGIELFLDAAFGFGQLTEDVRVCRELRIAPLTDAQNRDAFARRRARRAARAVTVLADVGLAAVPEESAAIALTERRGGA